MVMQSDKKSSLFLWFIRVAYATQGISRHFGLLSQPLDYFMLKGLGKNAADVVACWRADFVSARQLQLLALVQVYV